MSLDGRFCWSDDSQTKVFAGQTVVSLGVSRSDYRLTAVQTYTNSFFIKYSAI